MILIWEYWSMTSRSTIFNHFDSYKLHSEGIRTAVKLQSCKSSDSYNFKSRRKMRCGKCNVFTCPGALARETRLVLQPESTFGNSVFLDDLPDDFCFFVAVTDFFAFLPAATTHPLDVRIRCGRTSDALAPDSAFTSMSRLKTFLAERADDVARGSVKVEPLLSRLLVTSFVLFCKMGRFSLQCILVTLTGVMTSNQIFIGGNDQ